MMLYPIEYKEGTIWVDKEANINEGNAFYDETYSPLYGIQYADTYVYSTTKHKIIAQSPNLSLPNIPYVEIEEDIENLVWDWCDDLREAQAFKAGYRAASTKKYTEEDLREAFEAGVMWGNDELPSTMLILDQDDYIQSLQSKIKSVEIEMTEGTEDFTGAPVVGEERPMTYQKHGKTYLKVKKVNYDN